MTSSAGTSTTREVASFISHAILEHVALAVREDAAAAVRTGAGEERTLAELAAHGAWSSTATALAIAEGAERCTGDRAVARRGGEQLFRAHAEIGMTDFLLSEGTVLAALERVVALSGTISLDRPVRIVDVADRAVVIEAVSEPRSVTAALMCGFSGGYWGSVPAIFGASGYTSEAACQAWGDDRCLTRVAWTAPKDTGDGEAARGRIHTMVKRIEELQASASELTSAKDVTTVLDLIVDRANGRARPPLPPRSPAGGAGRAPGAPPGVPRRGNGAGGRASGACRRAARLAARDRGRLRASPLRQDRGLLPGGGRALSGEPARPERLRRTCRCRARDRSRARDCAA